MDSGSIVIQQSALVRNPSYNHRTQLELRPAPVGFDAKRLFLKNYRSIKHALESHPRQGLLAMAFGPQPLGSAWVAASLDKSRSLVIGRHSACDLVIPPAHDSVSLRHLALLVRAASFDESLVRVLDLHTDRGFRDEIGRSLRAITTDGSLFLSIGSVQLALFQTGPDVHMPRDAELAYAAIPERIYLDESAHEERHSWGPTRGGGGQTVVQSDPGPLWADGKLRGRGEEAYLRLTLTGREGGVSREVGRKALERGLIIGRYARCDLQVDADTDVISRTHLLLVLFGEQLLAVDLASSNGSYLLAAPFRAEPLPDGRVLTLGKERDVAVSVERC